MTEYCSCAGQFTETLSKETFVEQMSTFQNIARYVRSMKITLRQTLVSFALMEEPGIELRSGRGRKGVVWWEGKREEPEYMKIFAQVSNTRLLAVGFKIDLEVLWQSVLSGAYEHHAVHSWFYEDHS